MSGEPRPPAGKPGAVPDPAAGGADPSMEDILASIRRILNEEDSTATAASEPAGPGPAAEEPQEDDALALSEDMIVSDPAPQASPPAPVPEREARPEPIAAEPLAAASAPAPQPPANEPPLPAPVAEALIAPAVAAAATASLGTLLRTVAAERNSAVSRGGPTIEDVVREAIRPMLKEWLDQHLPGLVERLVRAEIERVVGRALS